MASAGQRVVVLGILEAPATVESSPTAVERVLARAHQLLVEGADGLDFRWATGERERGPTAEDLHRFVRALRSQEGAPIVVTASSRTMAEEAVAAGASILATDDAACAQTLGEVAARAGAGLLLGHRELTPSAVAIDDPLGVDEVVARLRTAGAAAVAAGVARDAVWFDLSREGGAQAILRALSAVAALGFPLALEPERLVAASGTFDPEAGWEQAAAVTSIAIAAGARVLRVRDVQRLSRVARMAEAISRAADGTTSS